MNTTINGVWHNQHHSVLHLVADGDRLTGTFRAGTGLVKGQTFPVQGWVLGDRVAFSVAFGPSGGITSWTGHLRDEQATSCIDTLWNMSVHEDAGEGGWRSIWTGADTFQRGEPALALVGKQRPSVPVRAG